MECCRIIEDLLTKGIDGIAVSPIDPVNQTELLNQAAKKTTLITHDSDAPDADRLVYIGMSNYDAGRLCGKLVKEALPKGGKIMIFIGRLEQDNAMHQRFRQFVERPATLCIPVLLALFWMGNGAAIYRPDFFEVPTDFWLNMYWLLLCGMLIYLLGYGARALLILRTDPRSRHIANVYLFASAMGIMACVVRIITALVPTLQTVQGSTLVWFFACACGAAFALTSAHSWRIKTKWFTRANS